jgi:endonuclease-8
VPEGPEIRRAADAVADVLAGQAIVDGYFGLTRLVAPGKRLIGARVTAVDTRGKAMLTRFDNGRVLYSHNQLYGRWYTTRRPELPDTKRDLRVALHTDTHSALLYSASDIEIIDASDVAAHPYVRRLGPDILDDELQADDVARRLRHPRFCNRSVGSLYLDQSFMAGLGNYLRSEILYIAKVAPDARPSRLDRASILRLARQTLAVSRRSYRTGGLTVSQRHAHMLKARGQSYAEYRFHVFAREGLDCYRCGSSVTRIQSAGRNLFLCPACQPSK